MNCTMVFSGFIITSSSDQKETGKAKSTKPHFKQMKKLSRAQKYQNLALANLMLGTSKPFQCSKTPGSFVKVSNFLGMFELSWAVLMFHVPDLSISKRLPNIELSTASRDLSPGAAAKGPHSNSANCRWPPRPSLW